MAKKFLMLISYLILCIFSVEAQSRFFQKCFFTQRKCPNRNVTFFLYTELNQANPIKLDMKNPASIMNQRFMKNRPLIILIHGYTGHRDFAPNKQIRPAYLQNGEYNIISVDYKNLALEPCYLTAVSNLPTVANCTAQLVDFLVDNKLFPLDSIHVIGFSLGAQSAGLIANFLSRERKLTRITGLDPAKPMFIRVGNDGRLDSSDAEFVDIIHTDVFARGVLMPSGHVDFYANGGFDQPGCYRQTATSPGSCNHDRASEYYAESINSEKGFWGFRCAHWYLYALGFCKEEESDSVAEMGFNAKKESVTPNDSKVFTLKNDRLQLVKGTTSNKNNDLTSEEAQ